MRTTLDLPDALWRRLKARAAREDTTLKDLVRELLERGMSAPVAPARSLQRRRLPSIVSGKPLAIRNPTNARLFQLLDDEG